MLTDERIHELWNASTKFINGYGQPEILKFARAIEAEASPASVPEGWKLVPVEATKKMCGAAYSDRMVWNGGPRAIYEAMLAAAPTPPVSEDRKDADRYRWLRSSSTGPSQIWELLSDDCQPPILTLKSMGDLDAAIDKAMQEDKS